MHQAILKVAPIINQIIIPKVSMCQLLILLAVNFLTFWRQWLRDRLVGCPNAGHYGWCAAAVCHVDVGYFWGSAARTAATADVNVAGCLNTLTIKLVERVNIVFASPSALSVLHKLTRRMNVASTKCDIQQVLNFAGGELCLITLVGFRWWLLPVHQVTDWTIKFHGNAQKPGRIFITTFDKL